MITNVSEPRSNRTKALRLLVADDHVLLLEAISKPLEMAGFDVCFAKDFNSTLEMIEVEQKFDVVLLDLNMPGMDGIPTIKTVVDKNSPGAVILFSGAASPIMVGRALEEGVKGFIPKSLALRTVENAVRLVASGERFVPYSFFQSAKESTKSINSLKSSDIDLSDRELKVLYGASIGQSNKEIAYELDLTEVSVKMYMRSICGKLNAKNRTQAAMIARQAQII